MSSELFEYKLLKYLFHKVFQNFFPTLSHFLHGYTYSKMKNKSGYINSNDY